MQFDWDPNKAASNLKKHAVSFNEAETVFGDPLASVFLDEDHSVDEKREIIIGYSERQMLLVISYTESEDELIRIISARRADSEERRNHER